MRFLRLPCLVLALCAAPAVPAQTSTARIIVEPGVLTQGYYRSQPQAAWLPGVDAPLKDGPVNTMYLRFYADGRVISVSTTGTPEQIAAWFDYTCPAANTRSRATGCASRPTRSAAASITKAASMATRCT